MTTAVAIFKSEGKVTFCGTEYFLVIQAARLSMMDSVPKKTCQNFLLILFFKPELWVGILNVIIRMQSTLPKFPAPRHSPRVQREKLECLTKKEI